MKSRKKATKEEIKAKGEKKKGRSGKQEI